MKSKRIFQIFVLLAILLSPLGGSQSVYASSNSSVLQDALVINRDLSYWNATYIGYVSSSVYEKWQFEFTAPHNFVIAVSPVAGDLVPLLTLFDANGNQLAQGTNTLASNQPAGTYFIQVQPSTGGGFYILTLREVVQTVPSVTTVVSPSSINAGDTALVTVSLNNVPAEGYTSAEFTCTYNATFVDVSDITAAGLFGTDEVVAINGPQGGSFIVAIAGSNGNKATTSGVAFTFSVVGLTGGQTSIECTARVSKGDNVLTSLPSTAATLTIVGSLPTATMTVTATSEVSPTPTGSETPVETATPTITPDVSPTATLEVTNTPEVSPTPSFTATPEVSPTATFTSTPEVTATATPLPTTITGKVVASKPVTVGLYNPADDTLVTSVNANVDGTFSLTAAPGTYTIRATASGFLSAEGSVTLTSGNPATMPEIALLAGDIDNNNSIDQFDALTIGMSYNTASPTAADLNNDNVINVLDLELLAQNYRETGPIAWQ